MATTSETPWLDEDENRAWRAVWALMTWLPTRLDAQLRAEAGMSLAEYNALSQISEAAERTLRLGELAVTANMTPSHLSRVMTRMERQGWVTRLPDPEDGRFTLGRLTEAGWEQVSRAAPGHVRAVRRYVLEGLSPKELTALGGAAEVVARAVAPQSRR